MSGSSLTLRLWLSEDRPNEPEDVAKRRSLLKPQLDQQSGNYYVELRGQDAFAIARTVPCELIQLITMRQTSDEHLFPGRNPAVGVYVHGDIEVILDERQLDKEIFITGNDIAALQEAYILFQEGRLLKRYIDVHCIRCNRTIRTTQSAIKKETRDSGVMHYVTCPSCGSKCTVQFIGEGGMMFGEYLRLR
jgi:hypothetical protein